MCPLRDPADRQRVVVIIDVVDEDRNDQRLVLLARCGIVLRDRRVVAPARRRNSSRIQESDWNIARVRRVGCRKRIRLAVHVRHADADGGFPVRRDVHRELASGIRDDDRGHPVKRDDRARLESRAGDLNGRSARCRADPRIEPRDDGTVAGVGRADDASDLGPSVTTGGDTSGDARRLLLLVEHLEVIGRVALIRINQELVGLSVVQVLRSAVGGPVLRDRRVSSQLYVVEDDSAGRKPAATVGAEHVVDADVRPHVAFDVAVLDDLEARARARRYDAGPHVVDFRVHDTHIGGCIVLAVESSTAACEVARPVDAVARLAEDLQAVEQDARPGIVVDPDVVHVPDSQILEDARLRIRRGDGVLAAQPPVCESFGRAIHLVVFELQNRQIVSVHRHVLGHVLTGRRWNLDIRERIAGRTRAMHEVLEPVRGFDIVGVEVGGDVSTDVVVGSAEPEPHPFVAVTEPAAGAGAAHDEVPLDDVVAFRSVLGVDQRAGVVIRNVVGDQSKMRVVDRHGPSAIVERRSAVDRVAHERVLIAARRRGDRAHQMVEVHRVTADLIGVRRGRLRSRAAEVQQRRIPDVDVGPFGEDHMALHPRAADRDLRSNDDIA